MPRKALPAILQKLQQRRHARRAATFSIEPGHQLGRVRDRIPLALEPARLPDDAVEIDIARSPQPRRASSHRLASPRDTDRLVRARRVDRLRRSRHARQAQRAVTLDEALNVLQREADLTARSAHTATCRPSPADPPCPSTAADTQPTTPDQTVAGTPALPSPERSPRGFRRSLARLTGRRTAAYWSPRSPFSRRQAGFADAGLPPRIDAFDLTPVVRSGACESSTRPRSWTRRERSREAAQAHPRAGHPQAARGRPAARRGPARSPRSARPWRSLSRRITAGATSTAG